MFEKKLLFYCLSAAVLTSLAYGETIQITADTTYTCTASDVCIIQCDTQRGRYRATVNCASVAECRVECTALSCFGDAVFNAQDSNLLTVQPQAGLCFIASTFYVPDYGQAVFQRHPDATTTAAGLLQTLQVYAGVDTSQIHIDCTGTGSGCTEMIVHAQTARFLRVTAGSGDDMDFDLTGGFPGSIYCPRSNSVPPDQWAAPCVIDLSSGGIIRNADIYTVDGYPQDLAIYGSDQQVVNVVLHCEIGGSSSGTWPLDPTNACANSGTWSPTTRGPTANPTTADTTTVNPTTVEPTSKPTTANPTSRRPTIVGETSANPTTANPTVNPTTAHPTGRPTTARPTEMGQTTANPTTANPSISISIGSTSISSTDAIATTTTTSASRTSESTTEAIDSGDAAAEGMSVTLPNYAWIAIGVFVACLLVYIVVSTAYRCGKQKQRKEMQNSAQPATVPVAVPVFSLSMGTPQQSNDEYVPEIPGSLSAPVTIFPPSMSIFPPSAQNEINECVVGGEGTENAQIMLNMHPDPDPDENGKGEGERGSVVTRQTAGSLTHEDANREHSDSEQLYIQNDPHVNRGIPGFRRKPPPPPPTRGGYH